MEPTNLSKTKSALRTSGAITGNFGKAKVKSGSTLNDVPANKRDSLGNFPTRAEYAARLRVAYNATSDQRLQAFILKELGKIETSSINHGERMLTSPQGPHCDIQNHFIKSYN
jgi:DNA-binding transcriptional regulator WhiA